MDGWYDDGIVAICAWERSLWRNSDPRFYEDHRDILARLDVPCEKKSGGYLCKFTERTARAYQLLHIFLHELGHHHDRMTTKLQQEGSRGEDYAEQYALEHADTIWNRYWEACAGE